MSKSKYRLIEIDSGCIGGESAVYYTDAPDQAIENAIENYQNGNDSAFEELFDNFDMVTVIDTMTSCYYSDIREKIALDKAFSID